MKRLQRFSSWAALSVLTIVLFSGPTCSWPFPSNQNPSRASDRARRDLLSSIVSSSAFFIPGVARGDEENGDGGLPVVKTSSGLKYIDLKPGSGPSPQYGQLVTVAYTAYIKLPQNSKNYPTEPQQFDKDDGYLFKHGNGRIIAGVDEGIHTMKLGGTRRLLIPPKLGYVAVGLGPQPDVFWNRAKLDKLLDQMVELAGGTVIYEVTLENIIVDEADQGYYQDESISEEEFAEIQARLQRGNQARIEEQNAANEIKGQDRVR